MDFLSIDVETGGLDYKQNDLLEISYLWCPSDTPLDKCKSLTLLLYPHDPGPYVNGKVIPYRLSLEAIWMHTANGLLVELSETEPYSLFNPINLGTEQHKKYGILKNKDTASVILNWFKDTIPKGKINICGKNYGMFDKDFLEKYQLDDKHLQPEYKFSHRVLDPGNMYVLKTDKHIPDLKECVKRSKSINIPAGLVAKPHRALYDAYVTAALIRNKNI